MLFSFSFCLFNLLYALYFYLGKPLSLHVQVREKNNAWEKKNAKQNISSWILNSAMKYFFEGRGGGQGGRETVKKSRNITVEQFQTPSL